MNVWSIETASGFDYAWQDPLLDPLVDPYLRISLTGTALNFDADGLPLSGMVTGFTVLRVTPSLPQQINQTYVIAEGLDPVDLSSITTLEDVRSSLIEGLALDVINDAQYKHFKGGPYTYSLIRLSGTDGAELTGTGENDFFELRSAGMVARAGAGADRVVVTEGTGTHYVNLGAGDDGFRVVSASANAGMRVWGQGGDDFIYGDVGDDVFHGGDGKDTLRGYGGNDRLYGGQGRDFLETGFGRSTLSGGDGQDFLSSTSGANVLWGGAGRDAFAFSVQQRSAFADQTGHRVMDFDTSADVLCLQGYGMSGLDAYEWFHDNAETRDWGTVLTLDGGQKVYLLDVEKEAFTLSTFLDGSSTNTAQTWLNDGLVRDAIVGTADDDRLVGIPGENRLLGLAGNDTLTGQDNNDTIFGGDGHDRLNGEGGSDWLNGGAGDDILQDDGVYGPSGDDRLIGGAGHDLLYASNGNDRLEGGSGRDFLSGGRGDDILIGGDGRDVLEEFSGNDRLWGGAGQDAYVFYLGYPNVFGLSMGAKRVMDFDVGTDLLYLEISDRPDLTQQEAFDAFLDGAAARIWGTVFRADELTIYLHDVDLAEVTVDNFVTSSMVSQPLNWLYDDLVRSPLSGTSGDDDVTGLLGQNAIFGGAGNDVLEGNLSNDILRGGDGNDQLYGNGGNDRLFGGAGNDGLIGNAGDDILVGGAGDDYLLAGSGTDQLWGGEGNDTLSASSFGAGTLNGGSGRDFLTAHYRSTADLFGGDGADLLSLIGSNATAWGGAGRDAFAVSHGDPSGDERWASIKDFNLQDDFLWLDSPSINHLEHSSQESFEFFLARAVQRDWGVLYSAYTANFAIHDLRLSDLTAEHFVPAKNFLGEDVEMHDWINIEPGTWLIG